ncbi:MAG: ISAzo13 family transposase [Caldilineaceae bacterium]
MMNCNNSQSTGFVIKVVAVYRPKKTPVAVDSLNSLLETQTAGDPLSRKKWVRCSLRYLSSELSEHGHDISHVTIRRLLKAQNYRLQSNRKELASKQHPDRDRQFRYIKRVRALFRAAGHPIISVDTKKKELIGNFKNNGRAWRQQAEAVNIHDFRQDALGRAVPYGIYDLQHNFGYVYVGASADTPEFAVDALAHWWQLPHRPTFADESKLLILADGGGSNGYRPRLWKKGFAALTR